MQNGIIKSMAGGVYFLQAVKRVRGMRIIMPKWSDRAAPKKSLAAAPKKVARPESYNFV